MTCQSLDELCFTRQNKDSVDNTKPRTAEHLKHSSQSLFSANKSVEVQELQNIFLQEHWIRRRCASGLLDGGHIPDLLGVLVDGAVGGEESGAGSVQDGPPRPLVLVSVQLVHLLLHHIKPSSAQEDCQLHCKAHALPLMSIVWLNVTG